MTKHVAKTASVEELETALGHNFADRELLYRALTHSSLVSESGGAVKDNEQFEFLGDAVLGFVTSQHLFTRFPEFPEGKLSKMRAHLVSARHLLHTAREIELGRYLRLGRGEEKTGGRSKTTLLVDALEATLAAIFLDGGIEPARRFIISHIVEPELARLGEDPTREWNADFKSRLQEELQAQGRPAPVYDTVDEIGPDHRKTFVVSARIMATAGDLEHEVHGCASTKKLAEQRAAEQGLLWLATQKENA
ncbi:MAG TPA: ribonuclease III [candidate division Zixibacteria bacterium]|nr:ribonuclease III [candidate division Zixibacteria bacterium]